MSSERLKLRALEASEDRGIDTCTPCPRLCRWACPVAEAEARETVSPHALVVLSGLEKRGVVPVESLQDLPYHCTHCGACTQACQHRVDVPLVLSLARQRVLAAGAAPRAVSELRGHFGVAGNPQGQALEGLLARAAEDAEVELERSGSTVYLPGCEALSRSPEVAGAMLRASVLLGLPKLSVTPLSAACCGLPLFWAGDLEAFHAHAQRFAEQARGVERLVVHDPACAHALQVRYRELDVKLEPEVVLVSRFFEEGVQAGRPVEPPAEPRRVAYADACTLARGLGQVEGPRALLARLLGAQVVELPGARGAEADCCGAQGLLPETAPFAARAMAEARVQAFKDSGAELLAVFSPRCRAHLLAIEPQLPIVDVAQLLARL